jgi:hypothetical protein
MRSGRLVVGVCVGLVALFAGGVSARRIVTVTAHCAAGTELQVDADGPKDACVATALVACPAGMELVNDRKGEEDVCATVGGGQEKTAKPTCPDGFSRKARLGGDACESISHPVCRKGYRIRVKVGEDDCVY